MPGSVLGARAGGRRGTNKTFLSSFCCNNKLSSPKQANTQTCKHTNLQTPRKGGDVSEPQKYKYPQDDFPPPDSVCWLHFLLMAAKFSRVSSLHLPPPEIIFLWPSLDPGVGVQVVQLALCAHPGQVNCDPGLRRGSMGVLGSLEGLLAEEETTGRTQTPTMLWNRGARMPYGGVQ